MSSSNHKILKLKDKTDSNVIEKTNIDNVPFRMLLVGGTGSGKSNLLANMILRPEFYLNDFHADDITIFTGSPGDAKIKIIQQQKSIEDSNIIEGFDSNILKTLYDLYVEEFNERTAQKKKPYQKLLIFDDLSYLKAFTNKDSRYVDKLFQNGRKYGISTIITSQKYKGQISMAQRANFSSCILYNTANSQVEAFESDVNYMKNKKSFFNMWNNVVIEKRDFLVVNHSNPIEDMYLNKDFIPINVKQYEI